MMIVCLINTILVEGGGCVMFSFWLEFVFEDDFLLPLSEVTMRSPILLLEFRNTISSHC